MYIGQALVSPFDGRTAGRPAIYRRRRRQRRFTCLHRERYNEFCDALGQSESRKLATFEKGKTRLRMPFAACQKTHSCMCKKTSSSLATAAPCGGDNIVNPGIDSIATGISFPTLRLLASYALCFFPSDGQTTSLA